jgi:hypothetical protein
MIPGNPTVNFHRDGRATRHAGYLVSQRKPKRVEEIFCWLKTVAQLRQTRHRGIARVGWMFVFGLAAYNLVRIRNLTWARRDGGAAAARPGANDLAAAEHRPAIHASSAVHRLKVLSDGFHPPPRALIRWMLALIWKSTAWASDSWFVSSVRSASITRR